ncbi:splicing regulator SDE2 isoform X2 [Brachyhypopomus gauderio]|uniref:splicing regulator SDE2 isoform X2 n=1 Tax=Brachyhypopomus gauderio TaxID=698409 RepID=UPI004041B8D9
MDVFVVSNSSRFLNLSVRGSTVGDLKELIVSSEGIPPEDFYIKHNGRISDNNNKLQAGGTYRLEFRLCGGKGGFGSMLRALGAQIEKTTNREACRDLSGRRLRDVNHEKEMAEWLKKQAEREAEKEQRRLERIQRKLAEPKHYFTDVDYEQQCHDLSERLEDSVLKGMQASSSGLVQATEGPSRKRLAEKNEQASTKRKRFWTGLEDLDSSDGDSDDCEAGPSSSSSPSVSGASGSSPSTTVLAAPSRGSEDLQSVASGSSPSTTVPAAPSRGSEDLESEPSGSSTATTVQAAPSRGSEDLESEASGSSLPSAIPAAPSRGSEDPEPQDCPNTSSSPGTCSPCRSLKQVGEEEEAGTRDCTGECTLVEENTDSPGDGQEIDEAIATDTKDMGESNGRPAESKDAQPVVEPLCRVEGPLDLLSVSTAEELEAFGLERLKAELMERGLKCGGTLQQRAARLHSVRGLQPDQIDPALLAKPSKGKKK